MSSRFYHIIVRPVLLAVRDGIVQSAYVIAAVSTVLFAVYIFFKLYGFFVLPH